MRSLMGILFALLLPVVQVYACSCPRGSIEEAFDRAKNVFIAHIVEVRFQVSQKDPEKFEPDRPQLAKFSILETMKGAPSHVAELHAGYGGGDCGVPLIAGTDYLVLVDDSGELNYCAGFFGPHYGWNDGARFSTPSDLRKFTQSVREHYKNGAKIVRPPPSEFGMEDSSSLWFEPLFHGKPLSEFGSASGCDGK